MKSPDSKLLARLLLLPSVLLAWPGPGGFLADDPYPIGSGTGLAAMGLLPVTLYLLVRPGRGAVSHLVLWSVAWLLGVAAIARMTDVFEGERALSLAAVTGLSYAAGTRLEREGRRIFLIGTCVLSFVWTGYALLDNAVAVDGHLGGVAGNTGPLSQAALPGAVIGAWFFARKGAGSMAGLLVATAFLVHAALAPVLAGGIAFLLALVALALLVPRAGIPAGIDRHRSIGLIVGALVLFGALRTWQSEDPGDPPAAADVALQAGDTGGLEVRKLVWLATARMVLDHPFLGVGPGQFQAAFPPYRDPREIELSRHGPCSEEITEVEHAHQDALQLLAELGGAGGLLAVGFLLLCLGRSVAGLRHAEHAPAAAAGFALLVNAGAHTPLSVQPASACLGFALFGMVASSRAKPDRWIAAGPWIIRGWAVALCLVAPIAWSLVTHGRALARYVDAVRGVASLEQGSNPIRARFDSTLLIKDATAAVAEALERAPNSWSAGAILARSGSERDSWNALLALRPHSFETWENLGLIAARAGDVDEASQAWQHALEIAPGHARVTKNLARLELEAGHIELGLAQTLGHPCLDEAWRSSLGHELILKGFLTAGSAVLTSTLDSDTGEVTAEVAFEQVQSAESHGNELAADGWKTLAHWTWAREHAEAGNFPNAIRSYRQALSPTMKVRTGGAPNLRLELAAAELIAGRTEDAAQHAEGLDVLGNEPTLPDWARDALRKNPDGL